MHMVRISRRNSSISAYEDMEGAFDWNRTPLAPLGSKAVVIVEADERPSWGNHARDAIYVGCAPLNYRLKEFYMCDTHGFVTAVGKIYPAHCRTPAISEDDLTIGAAAELIETTKGTIPATATKKLRHTETLKKLVAILENREPPRVANGGQPRVSPAASTSSNPTSPRVIAKTKIVHQQQTRNNIPLPIIQEEEDVREATPPQQV